MADNVIQGVATLDIAPFLASLATLEATVNATVSNVGLALQRVAASASQGMAGMVAPLAGASAQVSAAAQKASNAATNGAKQAQQAYQGFGATLTQHQAQLKKIEDQWNSIYRAGAQISQVAQTMVVLGAGILAVEGLSVKAASGLDFWIAKYRSAATAAGDFLVQEQDTAAATRQIEEIYRNVAVETGESVASVAESAYRWQSAAGTQIKSVKELLGQTAGLTTMIKASVIAGIDQQTVIRGVAQIIGAYNLNAADATRVTETMANAAQISNAEFGDFVESAKMGAVAARLAGVPFEEYIAILARLSNVGQRGTQAGRGMQVMLQGLVDPGNEANAALQVVLSTGDNIGKSWRDLIYPGGEFVGLMDRETAAGEKQLGLIGQLYQATQKMTQVDREQFLAKITTQNAYRILAPLIQAYGQDLKSARRELETGVKSETLSLSQLNAILSDSVVRSKSFNDQWEIVSKTINRLWAIELQRFDAAIGQLGTTASGALLPLVHTLSDIALGIRTWMLENPKLASQLASIGTAVAGVLVVLGPLGWLVGQVVQGFVAVGGILRAGVVPILSILGGSLGAIALRLGLLGVAAVLLVNAWRNNWLGLTPVLDSVASAIKNTLGVALFTVGRLIEIIGALFAGDWSKAWDLFLDVVLTVLALFKLNLERQTIAMYQWGVNLVGQLAKGLLDGAGAVLSGVLSSIGEMIAGFFRGASPPKEGPLSTIDKWGEGVMAAYGLGLRRGAEKHLKPAAADAAKLMSKPLEGHSPAKEGPLSEIANWGTNLMDAFLRGFKKADFSVLNEAAQLASSFLKSAVEDKKISPAAFLGDMAAIKVDLTGVLDVIRRGGELAASAFDRVKQLTGSIGNDLQSILGAYNNVAQRQKEVDALTEKRDQLKAKKYENYDQPKQALEDESKDLEITKRQWLVKKQAITDAVEALNRQKWPLQDEIQKVKDIVQGYQDKVDAIGRSKHALEDEKRDLEEQKYTIQATVDAIQEEVDKHREAGDEVRLKISDLRDERNAIKDQVDEIEHRYDAEKKGAQAVIDLLRDQLSLLRDQNEERLKPLQATVKAADSALEDKRLADKDAEEQVERRIADYRARGASGHFIDSLENQLRLIKNQHADEERLLEDRKKAAQTAVDAAKDAAQVEEDALDKQLSVKERAEKDAQRLRDATIAKETVSLQKRLDAIDKESSTLEKQAKVIEGEIAVDEKRAKVEEEKSKNLDKRVAAIDKDIRGLDKQADNIQHSMTVEQLKQKNIEREVEAIDRNVTLLQRREASYDDEIKVIDRRQEVLGNEQKLLEKKNRPLLQEIEAIDRQIEAAGKTLQDAKERLEIEQSIADIHEQDRKEAADAAKMAKSGGWAPGAPADENDTGGMGKSLSELAAGWRNELLKQFKLLSPELEVEREKIRSQIDGMFTLPNINEKIKQWTKETFTNLGIRVSNELHSVLDPWNQFWGEDFYVVLDNAPGNLEKAVNPLLDIASAKIREWSSDAKKDWNQFWSTVLPSELSSAQKNLEQATSEALGPLQPTANNIFGGIRDSIVGPDGETGIVGGIRTSIADILGRDDTTGLRKEWKKAHDGFDSTTTKAFTAIKEFLFGEKGVITILDSTIRNVLGDGDDDSKGLRSVFKGAFDSFANAMTVIDQPIKTVKGWLQGLQTTAEDALNAIRNATGGGNGGNAASDAAARRQQWIDSSDEGKRWAHDSGIPGYAEGGIVPGPLGMPRLIVAHGGETYLGVGKSLSGLLDSLSLGVARVVLNGMPTAPPEIHNHYHVGMVVSESGDFKWLARRMRQQDAVHNRFIAVR